MWYVASLSEPLPSLLKLCPCGQKWLYPGGPMFNIGKHEKPCLKPQVLNLYQVCSNYAPGAKNCPAPGVACFT